MPLFLSHFQVGIQNGEVRYRSFPSVFLQTALAIESALYLLFYIVKW